MSELEGKTLCFAGTFATQNHAQASAAATMRGATVTNSVTGKTSILVCGPTGGGAKLRHAKEKGIDVWTEEKFNAEIEKLDAKKSPKKSQKKKKAGNEPKDAPTPKKSKKMAEPQTPPAKKPAAKKPLPATPAKQKDAPTPKKIKKEAAAAKKPAAAKKLLPATPAPARKVMSAISYASQFTVHGEHDVKLMLSDSLNANSNKFYKLQLLRKHTGKFFVATNWGRLGEPGKSQLKGPHDEQKGIEEFSKKFRQKTMNAWGAHPFVRHGGKYQIVETTIEDDGSDSSAALGRLSESQIYKGQAVLKEIRSILEEQAAASRKKKNADILGTLSNDFYSLIPTTSGRQRPPRLDNLEIVAEKEGLLEFWLRMGFDEVSSADLDGSPIVGVLGLPLPPTLSSAANNIADNYSISSSQQRGEDLAKIQAGGPKNKMGKELYAAILLYTGNSIYRELNRCLRTEWKSVPKYWNYLRLYFEAMAFMPKREITLWRGVAADLYDEYEAGKVITWWTVSSCTADKSVAENFMNQLGGGAATLLTLHTKTACDISCLSFYPHEKESLLRPGTKLRVLNRKKVGKIAEIEVEEVLEGNDGEEYR